VSASDVDALGNALVFAVTRSLDEANRVANRSDTNIVWGCGVHPGVRGALINFNEAEFRRLLPEFLLVGEVGLDRRGAERALQVRVFEAILNAVADLPTLCSVHSSGLVDEVLDMLAERPPRGCILHWFNGAPSQVTRATQLGFWFSVNAAMTDSTLSKIPVNRVLTETDFPATRWRGVSHPGSTASVERRLSSVWQVEVGTVRVQLYRNLRALVMQAGLLDRLPDQIANLLVRV
jgi:TatD DNase family protein